MHRRSMVSFLQSLRGHSPAERTVRLQARIESHAQCPVARYLLGCEEFDAGRPATAVRHWMIAYHASWQLESAAFLVFAGLKLSSPGAPPLLQTLVSTWQEYRRPRWGRYRLERAVFAAFPPPRLRGPKARSHADLPKTLEAQLRPIPLQAVRDALIP